MFTGIVETIGNIISINESAGCIQLNIQPVITFEDIKVGDSIAVNGVCLTVTCISDDCFSVQVVPETQRLTNLNADLLNNRVNLERSMTAASRIGGHFVQGHVDNLAEIISIKKDNGDALMVKFHCNKELLKYIVKKGYICIDGMSLTIVDKFEDGFTLTLIPHTQQVTIAQNYRIGSKVNLEVDIMAKQIESLLEGYKNAS